MDRYAPAALTLVDGATEIKIRPGPATAGDPIACPSWDLGSPEVRISSTPLPGADGVEESGGYLGSRTVTMDLLIRGDGAGNPAGHDAYWYVNQLTGMCHPSRRPVLKIARSDESSGGVEWRLGLRGNPWSLTWERSSAAMISMTLTFTAPLGLFESDLHTVVSSEAGNVATTDWRFPATFPKGFGPLAGKPNIALTVGGTSAISPILYVNGPAKDPWLRDSSGQVFKFAGLTLIAGQTVRIDMGTGTVLVADPETGWTATSPDVFHTVDFEDSTFWTWKPGLHTVDLLNDTGSFAVQWRDRSATV